MSELLTIAYCEREQQPVKHEVAAIKVDSGSIWICRQANGPFTPWAEFTPVWQSYIRMGLVVDLRGKEIVCANGEEIIFSGNEVGFQLTVQLRGATLYCHQSRKHELAHFHDGGSWAWNPEPGSNFSYGDINALTIAPASYFTRRYDQDPQQLLRPRERPSALAESLR